MSTPAHFIEVEKLEPKAGHRIAAYLLTDYLERLGVEVIFGLCGHTVIAFLDALGKSKIRFISTRHEQVAAHAADGPRLHPRPEGRASPHADEGRARVILSATRD